MIKKTMLLVLMLSLSTATLAQIYKYKDSTGKWVFTDKKPKQNVKVESLRYKSSKKSSNKPKFYGSKKGKTTTLSVKNDYYIPIEVEITSASDPKSSHRSLVPAKTTSIVYESEVDVKKPRMRWALGDPSSSVDGAPYQPPVAPGLKYEITQSFNGQFSHNKPGSQYAVDIAMKYGSPVTAARGGIVFIIQDGYNVSGKSQYFLDKANAIFILHEDGTYAMYAHLMASSALVNIGDKVSAGQTLARSGSSGYSTGPHLHFAIQKNVGFKSRSVPFSFMGADGASYTPTRGMMISSGK